MAKCTGTVGYFCCCGDTCSCDNGCCTNCDCSCACNNANCAVAGKSPGACCTCRTNDFGFAWPCFPCCVGSGNSLNPTCGNYLTFYRNCSFQATAVRVDTGPALSLHRMADFTKPLFMEFAPLSQGIITNMSANPGTTCS